MQTTYAQAPLKRAAKFVIAFMLLVAPATAYAVVGPQTVSLIQGTQTTQVLQLYPNSSLTLRNDHESSLRNIRISKGNSAGKILEIASMQPGQSINLSFSKSGLYRICYLSGTGTASDSKSCVLLNLLEASEV
ncbi:MAG: hypothetical protein G3M78_13985 [Candidatus Nitrohelix vancouverensis]|uniref:EfeO-type cupredoxin-like domain-containing protein n=1 Tax=Candidatus Nitrohelix vancouverensis TaxID=2705534 RepID=A0A7T0C4Q6_9BACT|nr:MAG: hypothetical protein G3M78_13985 [Candidatus Nitrohelix vancouverensis]